MDGTAFAEGYYNTTSLHPTALVALLIAAAAMMTVQRRYALIPMLALACCIAPAQRVVVLTLDFSLLRMMILMGWTRILMHGDWVGFQWKPLDIAVLVWGVCATVVPVLAIGTSTAAINRLGYLYDAYGMYFLFRCLIRDWDDVLAISRAAAVISVPVMFAFLLERTTGRNIFSVFGGVPEFTIVRDGRLRCQGPFLHPILAGAFWSSLLPLMFTLWRHGSWNRQLAMLGACSAIVIIWNTSSATSKNSLFIALIAVGAFPIWRWMGWLRWAGVLAMVILHFTLVGPLWSILAKMNSVSGSTGWYRYKLIDDFIMHFFDWWALGTDEFSTWWAGGRFALTSEYVMQGVRGGLVTLLAFFAIIAIAFMSVGQIMRSASRQRFGPAPTTPTIDLGLRALVPTNWTMQARLFTAWALGASLLAHCAVFIGVAYFAQAVLMWYFTLGLIGSLTPARSKVPAAGRAAARVRSVSPAAAMMCSSATRAPGG